MANKGRKICKELCNRCRFEMNISTGYGNQKNTGKFCGYALIEKKCRTVDDGKIIPDCEKYCDVFEEREGDKRTTRDMSPDAFMKRPPMRTQYGDIIGGSTRIGENHYLTKVLSNRR